MSVNSAAVDVSVIIGDMSVSSRIYMSVSSGRYVHK